MDYPKGLYNKAGEARVVHNEKSEEDAREAGYTEPYSRELVGDYPRSLYMAGDRNAEHIIVADEKEEKAARKRGFKNLDEVEGEKEAAA